MKKRIYFRIIIPILIGSLLLSTFYYINFIRLENLDDLDSDFDIGDYNFDESSIFDASYEVFGIETLENLLFIENSSIFEDLIEKYEEIFFIVWVTGASFESLVFFRDFSNNETSGKEHSQEVEGINLLEEEMEIFNLIQEFLSNNRVFDKEKAISYVQSRYNKVNGKLNYNGIKEVITSLIRKCVIGEGSKLTRKTVLLNLNRNKIQTLIKLSPGIYINKLANKLHLSFFVVKWHISILLKFNFIRQRNFGGHIAYFNNSLNPANDIIFHVISREKCSQVIKFLEKNNNGCTKYQISKELGMHYNTISKYINKMEKFDLLIREKSTNKEYIYLNNAKLQELTV